MQLMHVDMYVYKKAILSIAIAIERTHTVVGVN